MTFYLVQHVLDGSWVASNGPVPRVTTERRWAWRFSSRADSEKVLARLPVPADWKIIETDRYI